MSETLFWSKRGGTKSSKRELINTETDKRFVRRRQDGEQCWTSTNTRRGARPQLKPRLRT